MTPRDSSENLVRRLTTWLPRLADPATVAEAAQAMRSAQFAALRESPRKAERDRLSREEEDARELEPYAAALAQLDDQLDTLLPAWVERFLEHERAGHASQERWTAAVKARGDLPDMDISAMVTARQVQRVLQAAGPRLDPYLGPIVAALGTLDRDRDHDFCAVLEYSGPAVAAATPALLELLRTQGVWRWPSHLARALANASRHDARVLPGVRALLSSDDPATRRSAMEVLAAIGPAARGASDQLLAFQNGSESDRCNMIHALSEQGTPTPEFLDVLDAAMRDPSGYVRRSACYALGRLTPDPDRFVPPLIAALDYTECLHDTSLPEAAVDALARYGPRAHAALPRLTLFLDGPVKGRTVGHKPVRDAIARIAPGRSAPARPPVPTVDPADLPDDEPLFPVRHDGRQCYVDHHGRIAIRTPFDWGKPFTDGRAIVADNEGRTFVIDRRGTVIFESPWRATRPFVEGLAAVSNDDEKWGFVDRDGRTVVEPQYDSVTSFSEGLAGFAIEQTDAPIGKAITIRTPGRRGYIDRTGRVAIPAQWSEAYTFHEGRAVVCTGGTMRYNEIWETETLRDRKYGYVDPTGRLVISGDYDLAHPFSEGRASVLLGDIIGRTRYGHIDATGRVVIPLTFTSASNFKDGLATVRRRGKPHRQTSTLIDPAGRIVSELPFRNIESFSEGLAAAYDGDAYGFVDPTGRWVIAPQFDQCEPFTNGLAEVQRGDWYALIDRDGQIVWGPTTDDKVSRVIESDWT